MKKLDLHIEMNDGTKFDVQSKTSDYLLFESTAKRHKWGGISDNPAKWEAFIAWAALKRLGLTELTWEDFVDEVDMVEGRSDDADPTPVGAGAGS